MAAPDRSLPTDASGRATALRELDLDRFFHPDRLVVVGASDTPGRPNTLITRRLQEWAERKGATFVPVNPNRATVNSVVCAASIGEVAANDGPIDLAVLLTGDVETALADAIAAGARYAVAFGAGFAEVGPEGRAAQDRIAAQLVDGTTHLLGPNTNLNAFEDFDESLPAPKIALISQSGHQGRPIFQAQEIGIGVSHWAPTGNEVDLEFADFVRYFADQPEVGVIAAYIEGFKDGRTVRLAAEHAMAAGTPIVIVKVGRSEAGASMAGSHTGKLTGSDAVTDAVFDQVGIARFDGLDEMLDAAQLFCRAGAAPKRPGRSDAERPGVAIYAISGGTGAHLADLCDAAGLRLPRLSDATCTALHQWIPEYLRVSNPIDNGGHPVGDERGRQILDLLVADDDIDVLICPITGAFPPMSDRLAQDLVDVAETTDTVICVIWGSPVGTEDAYREILLGSSKVSVFRTFGNCVGALAAWQDWHRHHQRFRPTFSGRSSRPSRPAAAVRAALADAATFSEWDAKQLLGTYGIPFSAEHLVHSAAEAASAARALGGPVVMKACAAGLDHKSELGLVRIGVDSAADVRRTYAELVARAPVELDGVIVSELVSDGVECVVGMAQDPIFGPVIMCGLGGVFIEVLGDVAFRVPPFDRAETRRMIDGLAGAALLGGVRGRPPADVGALIDVIAGVQRVALDLGDAIAEIDLNPVLVRPPGLGAVALDALVVPR